MVLSYKTDNFQLLQCNGSYGTLAIVHFIFEMPSLHISHSVTVPFNKAFMKNRFYVNAAFC